MDANPNADLAIQLVSNAIAADILRRLWNDKAFVAEVADRAKEAIIARVVELASDVGRAALNVMVRKVRRKMAAYQAVRPVPARRRPPVTTLRHLTIFAATGI